MNLKKYKNKIAFGIIIILVGIFIFLIIDNIIMPIYVQKGKTTKVPDVIGLSLEEGQKRLKDAGLEAKLSEYKADKRYAIGTIALQNPSGDTEVKYGRGVYLTISGGEELVTIPSLKGKSVREATFNLEHCGLKLGNIIYEPSDEIFANTIIRQEPIANYKVKSGTRINVIVSQGKSADMHQIPEVTLKTLIEAEKILINDGFQVGKITYQVNLDLLPNTVLEQYPRAGELMPLGQSIDLIVAQKADKKIKVEN